MEFKINSMKIALKKHRHDIGKDIFTTFLTRHYSNTEFPFHYHNELLVNLNKHVEKKLS